MNLRKNWYTYLFSGLFVVLLLYACCRAAQWAIYLSTSQTSITGILIFCIVLFIVLSYFVKEGDFLSFFQENRVILWILEIVYVAVLVGFFIYSMSGMDLKELILSSFLMLSTYLLGRLCGGRLAGMTSLAFSYFLISQIVVQVMTLSQMLSLSVFMGSAIISLCVIKFADLAGSYLVQNIIYIMLSIMLTLACISNPLVIMLVIALILALVFSSPRGGAKTLVLVITFILTFAALHCILVMMNHQSFMSTPIWNDYLLPFKRSIDSAFSLKNGWIALFNSILEKYEDAVFGLYVPFASGVLPTIILFLCSVAGIFTMKRKEGYIYPVLYSFIGILVLYILFNERGTDFIYLYTLLPVFAGYAFEQFLISPNIAQKKNHDVERAQVKEESKEEPEIEEQIVQSPEPEVIIPLDIQPSIVEDSSQSVGTLDEEEEEDFADLFTFSQPDEQELTSDKNIDVSAVNPEVKVEEGDVLDGMATDANPNSFLSTENAREDEYDFNHIDTEEDDVNDLLSRLGVQDNIERMNNAKREDMAEWIEKSPQNDTVKQAKRVINESEMIIPEMSEDEREPEISIEDEYKAPPVLHFKQKKMDSAEEIGQKIEAALSQFDMDTPEPVPEPVPVSMPEAVVEPVVKSAPEPIVRQEPVVRKYGVGNRTYVSMKINHSKRGKDN